MKYTIKVGNKYLYVLDEKGKSIDGKTIYFEHFKGREDENNVIKLSSEDKEGERFIKNNNFKIINADVYWFSKKKLAYKIMFIKQDGFSYLILITPKLLSIIN